MEKLQSFKPPWEKFDLNFYPNWLQGTLKILKNWHGQDFTMEPLFTGLFLDLWFKVETPILETKIAVFMVPVVLGTLSPQNLAMKSTSVVLFPWLARLILTVQAVSFLLL